MNPFDSRKKAIDFLVEKYSNDFIMLDALNQWAMNPTSASAGYGIEKNYPCIQQNLKIRYPNADLDEVMKKLRVECSELASNYDVYKCRDELQEIIDKRNGERLRKSVVDRLNKLTLEQKKILYICLKLDEKIREPYNMITADSVTSRFFAAGITTTFEDAISIAVKTGFFDGLLWISSSSPNSGIEYCIPKFVEPLLEKIDERIEEDISDLPDAEEYVKLLVEKEKFEQLRLLDELVDRNGVSGEPAYRKMVGACGIIGRYRKYYDYVATSPLIHDKLKRSLQEEKARLVQSFKLELQEILLKTRNERFPEVELFEGSLNTLADWTLEAEGISPLHIVLVPWILRKHMLLMKEECYLVITTSQSLPSISKIRGDFKGRNLTAICRFGKTLFIRFFGKRHKMMDEIVEKLRQNGYKIREKEEKKRGTIDELEMQPESPFKNLTQLFDLMEKLKGPILLLDKHFNAKGFMFLRRLDATLVSNVKLLTSRACLKRDFKEIFKAFKEEMANQRINVELRILDARDAEKVHDRYLMSSNLSYNTPPWNVVHKTLGDIIRINDVESKRRYFKKYWSRATDVLKLGKETSTERPNSHVYSHRENKV